MRGVVRSVVLLCTLALPWVPAHAATFQIVLQSPFASGSQASVSPDGRLVGVAGFHDSAAGESWRIELSPLLAVRISTSSPAGVPRFSSDGSVMMWTEGSPPVTHRREGGVTTTEPVSGAVNALAADGQHFAGTVTLNYWPQAYVAAHEASGPPEFMLLGSLSSDPPISAATSLSSDGSVVVGITANADLSAQQGFHWDATNGMLGLDDLPDGGSDGWAHDVTPDARTIVGFATSASGKEAAIWRDGDGPIGLGDLAGGAFESQANAVSADGSRVVGWSTTGPATLGNPGTAAFFWDPSQGMRDLKTLLQDEYGLDLSRTALDEATDISDDGGTIVGTGHDLIIYTPLVWVAVIPEPGSTAMLVPGVLALLTLERRRASSGSRRG